MNTERLEGFLKWIANRLHCYRSGHSSWRFPYLDRAICERCGFRVHGEAAKELFRAHHELTSDEVVNTFGVGDEGFAVKMPAPLPALKVEFPTGDAFNDRMRVMMSEIDWARVNSLAEVQLERLKAEVIFYSSELSMAENSPFRSPAPRPGTVYADRYRPGRRASDVVDLKRYDGDLKEGARNLAVRQECIEVCARHNVFFGHDQVAFVRFVFQNCEAIIMLPREAK